MDQTDIKQGTDINMRYGGNEDKIETVLKMTNDMMQCMKNRPGAKWY